MATTLPRLQERHLQVLRLHLAASSLLQLQHMRHNLVALSSRPSPRLLHSLQPCTRHVAAAYHQVQLQGLSHTHPVHHAASAALRSVTWPSQHHRCRCHHRTASSPGSSSYSPAGASLPAQSTAPQQHRSMQLW